MTKRDPESLLPLTPASESALVERIPRFLWFALFALLAARFSVARQRANRRPSSPRRSTSSAARFWTTGRPMAAWRVSATPSPKFSPTAAP